jgi:hypothetical protein
MGAAYSWGCEYGSASAWLPDGYDESDPHFNVKGLDADGEEFEADVRIKDIDPQNSSPIQMVALNAYLRRNGKYGIDDNIALPYAPADGSRLPINSLFDKVNHLAAMKDMRDMQRLHRNYVGYQLMNIQLYQIMHFKEYILENSIL